MNRRAFIRWSGLAALALITRRAAAAPRLTPVEYQGRLFRGAPDGKILVSETSGKTWRVHTHLGAQYHIQSISSGAAGRLTSLVAFGGNTFCLTLADDGRYWQYG